MPETSKDYTVNLTLTVSDQGGNSDNDNIIILVDSDPKVEICHDGNSMTVSENAFASHESHGDTIGSCTAPLPESTEPGNDNSKNK